MLRKFAFSLLIAATAVSVTACGSSTDLNQVSGQQGAPVVARSITINPDGYFGVNRLDNGQIGGPAISVNAQTGRITGTFQVSSPTNAQALEIEPTSYEVEGVANLTNGAYAFGGSFGEEVGDFTVTGTLPTPTGTSAYELEVGERTYAGVLQGGGTPPIPEED